MPNGLALAIVLLTILMFVAYIISMIINFFSPFFVTPKKSLKEIIKYFDLKKEDSFADLGSGDGRVIFQTYKEYGCSCTGYEISPMLQLWVKIIKACIYPFNSKIEFLDESFFKADLSKHTAIYCNLPQATLHLLEKKQFKKLDKGVVIYTLRNKLKDRRGKKMEIGNEVVYKYTI